jgi:hypothetical protein
MNRNRIPQAVTEVCLAFAIVFALAGAIVIAGNWDDFLAHCADKYGADR